MGLLDGLIKNVFPKNTVFGKALGSTRTAGTGLVGGIFEKKEKARREAAGLTVSPTPIGGGTSGGGGGSPDSPGGFWDKVKQNPILYGAGALVFLVLMALGFKALSK